mgnify:CR=1 FL=1
MKPIQIRKVALEFIMHAARNTYPDEFIGLLRKNRRGEIAEVLVIPQSEYGRSHSAINFWNVPYTSRHCGSVHSHPNRVPYPSRADLAFFSHAGELHLIICRPFTERDVRAFDAKGRELPFEIV